ncbi:unnamed protein product [Rotaria magnacalcarata]|uniref:Succinate dehydrogenase cytochrome b560 subunit, mitochondrial n=3 Tax=Rotaria magnacalcarata TaxID=392030 RepID=A0A816QV74_9BILA|nr:unnamed protein product [Rotaria magnacalcarata]CAF1552966.1 unnamed protein product [Rotaria magnacalcarata]CAF2033212.1 unnamed protein product [Rotaria magnacalcarata]CAF2065945.1 unnamed protein product [Rotaria magnacalcarata]CAF2126424.1 unnamed protein product [Rotaria magnacalcarata]
MSIALLSLNRQLLARALSRQGPLAISQQVATSSTVTPQVADYRARAAQWVATNENCYKRPVSPHLLIYKIPFQMWSSGFHRITGLMLNGMLYTAGPLAFLATGHSAEILNYIYAMDIPSWFILSVKLFMAWPISYHAFNGIRHLAWDMGKGFENYRKISAAIFLLSFITAFGIIQL